MVSRAEVVRRRINHKDNPPKPANAIAEGSGVGSAYNTIVPFAQETWEEYSN